MKITCLIDNLGSGGAQRQMVTLATLLRRRGHDVRFLTYYPHDFYVPILAAAGIEVTCVDEPRPLPRILKIRRALRGGAQDVVVSFLETPCLLAELAALPRRRWALIVSERNADPALMKSWRARVSRRLHRLADFVTTNSEANRHIIERLDPRLRGRVRTIYNAVDFDQFHPAPDDVPLAGPIRVVVAASHVLQKNFQGFADGLCRLPSAIRDRLRVDWYGNQEAHPRLFAAAADRVRADGLDRVVRLLPPTPGIADRVREADAVALLSHHEGLPNAICEGMACGKPVVLTRVSDAERLVREGENGFLCDPADPQSIADAFRKLVETPRATLAEMGQRSRLRAEELFDPGRFADRYLAIFDEARARRGGAPRRPGRRRPPRFLAPSRCRGRSP